MYQLPKMNSKRGQNALVGGTIAMVTVVILLFVSLLLVSKVRSTIDKTGFSAADNTTFDSIVSNSNTAFTLVAIALIVLVAFLIISILRGA